MLDMGFAEDIESILQEIPAERQMVLFSATMPPRLGRIADRYLRNPTRITIARETETSGETPLITQTAYVVHRAHKLAALGRILDVEAPTAALIFCRTRHEVDELTEALNGRGYRAEALHGGMSQEQRDRVMGRLRNGTADLLIATDVAARGLDIDQLTHVVNYDVPSAPESYVHRIGRVGRAGREGVAITLAEPREHRLLKNIERVIRQRLTVAKLPTMADLRARRLEITRAAIRETILADDMDRFRVVVESLSDEFDIMDIALAAVKLAHAATGPEGAEEQDIPDAQDTRTREGTRDRGGRDSYGGRGGRDEGGARGTSRAGREGGERAGKGSRGPRGSKSGMVSIYIAGGRSAAIRPQDLVGAIANEANLSGRDIGAIQIGDDFSLVDVPEDAAAHVIDALRATKIKGKKVTVRRDRFAK
jgi:ATP-dependent RNA helicase DeaD